jgi:1-acyl-sn-glycerol-3-phosphate acyltransferase
VRRFLRFVFAVCAVLAGGIGIRLAIAWDRYHGRHPLRGTARRVQRGWCRLFCRAFGIELARGQRPLVEPPALIAANHISWLDIVVLSAYWPVAFLSKSEVARWPIIGGVAAGLGTLFIERGGPTAARDATARMAEWLDEGGYVVFFPEGTTGDGRSLRAFRPRLFQAAIDAASPVQPVGISYTDGDGAYCPTVPFMADQSLASNVWALAGVPRLSARAEPGEQVAAEGRRRNELAQAVRAAMVHVLDVE